MLAAARDQLMDLSGQAKQQAIGLVTRADPASGGNYLATTRPGAMAATVASCVAIGGGAATYCAVEGVPESLRAPLGLERAASADSDLKKAKPPAKRARTAQDQPAPLVTDHPPADSDTPEPPQPEQAPTQEVTQPPSTPAGRAGREFGFEGANGDGGGAGAQASSNQGPELSAPAGQPLGGGGPGGFER